MWRIDAIKNLLLGISAVLHLELIIPLALLATVAWVVRLVIGRFLAWTVLGVVLWNFSSKIPPENGWWHVALWVMVGIFFLFAFNTELQREEKAEKGKKALGGVKKPPALTVLSPDFNSMANIKAAKESCFTINTALGHGSGFLITVDGWALTNRHVVENDEYFEATFTKNGKETVRAGKRLITYEKPDIAIVKIDIAEGKPLRLNFELPEEGDDIFVIGTPLDEEYRDTVTKGVVSAIRETDKDGALIQSDASVHPGNSGGPMLDTHGNVVAVTVSKHQEGGINFFIPVKEALAAIKTKQVKAVDKII